MIRLSLCIPTYNRSRFIGETLENIVQQATDEIEIVISDNASEDNTEEVVRTYQEKFPRITYFRWDRNMGADKNFLKVIELAKGEYCWFVSSDDCVEENAIQHVLWQLTQYPDIGGASVDQIVYSFDLKHKLRGVPIAGGKLCSDYLFTDREKCISILGLYFGYLSGQIINRSLWNQILSEETLDPYMNAFVHVYVIGKMLHKNPHWLYVSKKCIKYRTDNDSFLEEHGVYGRQRIAHESFEKVIRALVGKNSEPYRAVLWLAMTGYMRGDLVNLKKNNASVILQFRLFLLYTRFYWCFPYYWLKVVPLFMVPRIFIYPLYKFYRNFYRNPVLR